VKCGSGVGAVLVVIAGMAQVAAPRIACAAALFDQPVSAAQLRTEILARPAAELAATAQIRGKFIQRRYLSGLPRPLVSSGEFTLAREQGILWHTLEPFASEFLLTPHGMTLRDGTTETHLPNTERPALKTALEMFLAIFALDVERLAGSFELYGLNDGDRWQVGLRPRDGGLAQVFERAVITGDRHVQRIELESPGGDRTEIEFSDVEARNSALDAVEAARFRR
jgi:hypothetical protein